MTRLVSPQPSGKFEKRVEIKVSLRLDGDKHYLMYAAMVRADLDDKRLTAEELATFVYGSKLQSRPGSLQTMLKDPRWNNAIIFFKPLRSTELLTYEPASYLLKTTKGQIIDFQELVTTKPLKEIRDSILVRTNPEIKTILSLLRSPLSVMAIVSALVLYYYASSEILTTEPNFLRFVLEFLTAVGFSFVGGMLLRGSEYKKPH